MKLDKKLLKQLVKESLEEAQYGHLTSIPGGGEKTEPEYDAPQEAPLDQLPPEEANNLGLFFSNVKSELDKRIKDFENRPKYTPAPVRSAEEQKKIIDELEQASKQMKEVFQELEALKNKLKTSK
jgi:hypothetical protein